MKYFTGFVLLTFAITSCGRKEVKSDASTETVDANLSKNLIQQLALIQKETRMSDEEMGEALRSWCNVHKLGRDLNLDVKEWPFTDEELTDAEVKQILLDSQELIEEHKGKMFFASVKHVQVLMTLLAKGEEAAADELRESIAREYHSLLKKGAEPENEFFRMVDYVAKSDPKLQEILDRKSEAERGGAGQPAETSGARTEQ